MAAIWGFPESGQGRELRLAPTGNPIDALVAAAFWPNTRPAPVARAVVASPSYTAHYRAKRRRVLAAAVALVVLPLAGRTAPPATISGAGTVPFGFGVSGAGSSVLSGSGTVGFQFGVAGTGSSVLSGAGTVPFSFGVSGTGSAGSTPTYAGRGPIAPVSYAAHHAAKTAKRRAYVVQLVQARQIPTQAPNGSGTVGFQFGVSGAGSSVLSGAGTVGFQFGVSGTGSAVLSGSGTVPLSFGVSGTGSAGTGAVATIGFQFGVSATGQLGPAPRRREAVVTADYTAHRLAQRARRRAEPAAFVLPRRPTPATVSDPPPTTRRTRTRPVGPTAAITIATGATGTTTRPNGVTATHTLAVEDLS